MSGDDLVPTLRSDVVLAVTPEGVGTLTDPLFGRRIRLDALGVALCRALLPEHGETVAVFAIATAIGSAVESVRAFATRLVALDLCATPRAAVRVAERRALAQVKAAPAAHLKVLAGARFGCTMCGSCCGGHNIGPVSEAVLAGLRLPVATLEPVVRAARRLDKELFVTLPGERATPGADVMCHASNGSCVFLDDVGKCRIHAAVGGDKKPLPCRIFPWELVATPTGVRVSVQRECRDFMRATGPDTPPLEDALEELTALVNAIGVLPTARAIPTVRGRELASWAEWEALEVRLMDIATASDGTDPGATFIALNACLEAGTGVDLATKVAAGDGFAGWRARLSGPLSQMLRAAPPPNERMLIRVDALRLLLGALESARGWVLARALMPLEGSAALLFKEHLRHALWSVTPLRASNVEAGLGRLVAEWVLARLVALARAREVKRFHVTDQDLQDGLAVVSFLFRHDDLQPILNELDPLTVDVFVTGLAAFLRAAPDQDAPDRRIELVKF